MSRYPTLDGTQRCAAPLTPAERAAFDGTGDAGPARAMCGACRFQQACATYALDHDVHGVWGGLNDDDRAQLRAQAGASAPVSSSEVLDELVNAWRYAAEPHLEGAS